MVWWVSGKGGKVQGTSVASIDAVWEQGRVYVSVGRHRYLGTSAENKSTLVLAGAMTWRPGMKPTSAAHECMVVWATLSEQRAKVQCGNVKMQ